MPKEKQNAGLIEKSQFVSRDLSWLKFNVRVLDQAQKEDRNLYDRLKFLAITASNLDEFFMIRVGSLYNYIDFGKERVDYSGLREKPFKRLLFTKTKQFKKEQEAVYDKLSKKFKENGFQVFRYTQLNNKEKEEVNEYFDNVVFPMLTPMAYDNYRTFPMLMNKMLIFGVITKSFENGKEEEKTSFIQIPQNLRRFYEFDRGTGGLIFIPIEEIIRQNIDKLYRNVEIQSASLFRVTRNGDVTLEESEDMEDEFIEELKKTLKTRKTGRVVRLEVQPSCDEALLKILKKKYNLDNDNVFKISTLIDYTSLFQIAGHEDFKDKVFRSPAMVPPLGIQEIDNVNWFEYLKDRDIMLHHPYNNIEVLLELLEKAAEDPEVLSIKITIYRLAKNSRITSALQKAAEKGKNVSVLFELKARFDEENNIKEAERLEKAGCFIIHGVSRHKTHTKMLLIVRKEGKNITRYVHLSSGNYNESTSKLYSDMSIISTNEVYANDVSEFFNVITGHSNPNNYQYILTAPKYMRDGLIELIKQEAKNAKKGLESGIIIKINSLEDQLVIEELYKASQAGVKVELIIRGICCIRPKRKGLSENINVRSIVGDFLEHSRIFYFHNQGDPKIYSGSADTMVRSFDRRIESLYLIVDEHLKKQTIQILEYNLIDNVNTYIMEEDGQYFRNEPKGKEPEFNLHEKFYDINLENLKTADVNRFLNPKKA